MLVHAFSTNIAGGFGGDLSVSGMFEPTRVCNVRRDRVRPEASDVNEGNSRRSLIEYSFQESANAAFEPLSIRHSSVPDLQ